MNIRHLLGSFMIFLSLSASAQLPNGSIAPNFTLTDLDGNTHDLYTYLDQGKVVFIKFFACHCPSCWAYHSTGKLDELNELYGPDGTDQVRVLMIEHDEYNGDAFYGLGGYTQGDWITGNSVPMIDAEGATDRAVFDNYNMIYYPMIYKICPDKTTELMSTGFSVAQLYQEADDCPGTLSIDEVQTTGEVYVDQTNELLVLNNFEGINRIQIFSALGQQMNLTKDLENNSVDLSPLKTGVYFLRIEHTKGTFTQKFYIR